MSIIDYSEASSSRRYNVSRRALSFMVHSFWGYQANPKDGDNLSLAREYLKKGPLIVYFNHTSIADGPLIIYYLLDNFGNWAKIIGGPESRKHFDFCRQPISSLIQRLLFPSLGLRMFPIVQHYDRDSYTDMERFGLLRQFIKGSEDILRPGGILFISPEGTRSDDGSLKSPQSGIEHLLRISGYPTHLLPVVITPRDSPEEITRRKYDIGKSFDLKAGRPFSRQEVSDIKIPKNLSLPDATLSDLLMLKLAVLLPEEMRGIYTPYTHPIESGS